MLPLKVAVPLAVAVLVRLTPEGAPESENVGVGVPVALTGSVKVPAAPAAMVALAALVNTAAELATVKVGRPWSSASLSESQLGPITETEPVVGEAT